MQIINWVMPTKNNSLFKLLIVLNINWMLFDILFFPCYLLKNREKKSMGLFIAIEYFVNIPFLLNYLAFENILNCFLLSVNDCACYSENSYLHSYNYRTRSKNSGHFSSI